MRVHTDWLLTPERAVIHLPTATAVTADLHLGYEQARQRRGEAIPAGGIDDVVAALTVLTTDYRVRRLVVAGDLVEDRSGAAVVHELLAWLGAAGVELTGIAPGNHDQGLGKDLKDVPLFPAGIELGGWRVVHGDGRLPRGRLVLGHFHPCLRWGKRIAAPCYLVGDRRIFLPAFSADAAAVNVLGVRKWRPYRVM